MKRPARRTIRWATRGLALLFAAGSLFWMLRVPYRPERAARAIPLDVHWVSRHEAPALRWADLSNNPLVLRLLEDAIGLDGFDPAAPLPERLQALLADRVWLAQSMPDPFSRRVAWYGSAWAGIHGRKLRWQIKLFRPSAVERTGSHAGRSLYRLHLQDLPPPWRLMLTFEEGLVLFCLSEDMDDLRRMLDAYDGRIPSLPDAARLPPAGVPDAVLVRRDPGPDWALAIEALNAEQTSLRMESASTGDAVPAIEPAKTPVWPAPWGDAAAVTAHIRPGMLASTPIPASGIGPAWAELRSALLPLGDGSPVMIGLVGDPFTGRYRGIRVPGLVLALKTDAAWEDVDATVSRSLDRLNARFQWGWIPADGPSSRTRIRVISGTQAGGARALPIEETPAYALRDGFLWVASNAGTLRALLDASPPVDAATMRTPHADEELLVQTDLKSAEPTLRLAYHVYRLLQIVEQRAPTPGETAFMAWLEHGLDRPGRFGRMEIGVRLQPGGPMVRATATHPQHATPCID